MQGVGGQILGRGVYSIAEAARLTRLPPRRVKQWFRGRDTPDRIFRPLFQSDYPLIHGQAAISFLDLIELNVGGTLRDMGVALQYLRRAYARLKAEVGDHPFCRREIYCGDGRIFTRLVGDSSNPPTEVVTGQGYFDQVIMPFLARIEYDPTTNQALRWRPSDLVVIDPAYRFGAPIIEPVGIPTSTLRQSYYANAKSEAVVAQWYDIRPEYVAAAVAFEDSFAA